MRTNFDALIVGAGPAGSAAAILLARAGWSVALIEKQAFPRRKVCGECLAASNLPLLEALGIGAAFAAAAGPELRQVALLSGEQKIIADLPAASDARNRWGRALGRETLDALLLRQAVAAGAHLLQPWIVRSIDGERGDWRCLVSALPCAPALSLRAPLAIAAHGSWEPLAAQRRQLIRRADDLLAFKANFSAALLAEGVLPVLALAGGYGGMVVADAGLTTVACCIRRDRLAACRRSTPGVRAGEAVEAWLKRQCGGVRVALAGARREGPWLAAGPLDPGIHLAADDGVLRIGNAAGEAHPIIGEGLSMALQSAWLLCTQLIEGGSRTPAAPVQREIAQCYARQWQRQFASRLRLAAAFAHLAMRPAPAAALMALARRWPDLLALAARWSGKTRCAVDPATIARLAGDAARAR